MPPKSRVPTTAFPCQRPYPCRLARWAYSPFVGAEQAGQVVDAPVSGRVYEPPNRAGPARSLELAGGYPKRGPRT
jgi:hypothetical protein